jgi:3-methyladenine DNA glycosylase AlkD
VQLDEVMKALEARGTAQNRKVWARHGVDPRYLGVSFADLEALRKQLKTDHALALALWATEVPDARLLATMVADPKALSPAELDAWARAARVHVLVDVFVRHAVAKSPHATAMIAGWIDSPDEYVARAGWTTISVLATAGAALPMADRVAWLARIEAQIHAAPNRAREAMNGALIALGGGDPALRAQAIATARRIGPVQVDHGQTDCKTPDAVAYIEKMAARQAKKAGGKAQRAPDAPASAEVRAAKPAAKAAAKPAAKAAAKPAAKAAAKPAAKAAAKSAAKAAAKPAAKAASKPKPGASARGRTSGRAT